LRSFLDTSAFAKLYLSEEGSERMSEVLAKSTSIVVSVLAEPEGISAMNRLRREGKMLEVEYRKLKKDFLEDLATFETIALDQDVVNQAVVLLESTPLRASDALHLASAHAADVDLFVTADQVQSAAARASGLKVLDPTDRTR
jgi:predicted nucleic acid-binding protein